MIRQVEQAAGLPENAGASTAGQVKKRYKLTDAKKNIYTKLCAIIRAEVLDEGRGHRQLPLDARIKRFSEIKDNVAEGFQKDTHVIPNDPQSVITVESDTSRLPPT